jgi:hypothetical protein
MKIPAIPAKGTLFRPAIDPTIPIRINIGAKISPMQP